MNKRGQGKLTNRDREPRPHPFATSRGFSCVYPEKTKRSGILCQNSDPNLPLFLFTVTDAKIASSNDGFSEVVIATVGSRIFLGKSTPLILHNGGKTHPRTEGKWRGCWMSASKQFPCGKTHSISL